MSKKLEKFKPTSPSRTARLNSRGQEVLDSTPKTVTLGYVPLATQVARMDALELRRLHTAGLYDDFIDDDDFFDEFDDLPDQVSPYEDVDHLIPESVKEARKSKIKPAKGSKASEATQTAEEDVPLPLDKPEGSPDPKKS